MQRPQRITPQPPGEWSDVARAEFGNTVSTGARRPVRLPAVVARHPTFLPPYMAWAKAIALHGVLPPRANALLALRTAVVCGSAFEWSVHAETAPVRAGLTQGDLDSVVEGPSAAHWSPAERALLQAVDELHETASVSDETWHALERDHDEAALIEIVFVVGHYTMLSMVANSVGLPPSSVPPPPFSSWISVRNGGES